MPSTIAYNDYSEVVDEAGEVTGYTCDECGEAHSWADEAERCCAEFECDNCGDSYSYEEDADNCCPPYECHSCGSRYHDSYDADDCCDSGRQFNGILPDLPDVEPYRLDVPEIEGRPARLCSIEQELARGGSMIASMLHSIGVSPMDYVTGYHYGGTGSGTAHVEEDGSLPSEGGEVIFDRFDLSRREYVDTLSTALTKIRQLRDLPGRPVTTSYQAGIHIHLAARTQNGQTMTPQSVAQLYELWCYAEDMLYSFSASGWERHRQRPGDEYSGYCKAVPKDLGPNTPKKVWRLMRQDRYFGLNFQRVFNAVGGCSCGAATMGDWNSCDCGAFDRATVEWRVFNSSTLPRTIHAWLIMAHAMTAYAEDHELGTLPAHPFGSQNAEGKAEVLQHLLEILPLTEGEKGVILEAWNRCPRV